MSGFPLSITSNQGSGFLSCAIAASILGGVSVFDGGGHVLGNLGGLSILGISSFQADAIGGSAIFIAVATGALRVRLPLAC